MCINAVLTSLTDPLRLLNQPRVIAEVIAGIILGPSVMMRIPGFQNGKQPCLSHPPYIHISRKCFLENVSGDANMDG